MSSIPVSEPGWEGWAFSDGYLVDQEGNRYHPLAVKASFFYRQTLGCGNLMYWRPDDVSQDTIHPAPKSDRSVPDSIELMSVGAGVERGERAYAATPPPPPAPFPPLDLYRGQN